MCSRSRMGEVELNGTEVWRARSHTNTHTHTVTRPPMVKVFFPANFFIVCNDLNITDRLKHVSVPIEKYSFSCVRRLYYNFSGVIHPEQIHTVMRQSDFQWLKRWFFACSFAGLMDFPLEMFVNCLALSVPLNSIHWTRIRLTIFACAWLLLYSVFGPASIAIYTWYENAAYAVEWLHFHSTEQIEAQTMKCEIKALRNRQQAKRGGNDKREVWYSNSSYHRIKHWKMWSAACQSCGYVDHIWMELCDNRSKQDDGDDDKHIAEHKHQLQRHTRVYLCIEFGCANIWSGYIGSIERFESCMRTYREYCVENPFGICVLCTVYSHLA